MGASRCHRLRTVPTGFSFEVVDANDYDELRPGYADEGVRWVVRSGGLAPGSTVVDLGAGTGQLSRRFVAHRCRVVAVDPAPNMRAVLAARLPEADVAAGTAESIPLGDASADAVVVGNAFHHFDRARAFAEIRRVLRPRGSLAVFWAWPLEREQIDIDIVRAVDETVEAVRTSHAIVAAYRSWQHPPPEEPGFGRFERREFPYTHQIRSARLSDLYATSSDVASLPEPARVELLTRIRSLAGELPETLDLPGRTVIDRCVLS
jgi:SAM-dependent methyltransferase